MNTTFQLLPRSLQTTKETRKRKTPEDGSDSFTPPSQKRQKTAKMRLADMITKGALSSIDKEPDGSGWACSVRGNPRIKGLVTECGQIIYNGIIFNTPSDFVYHIYKKRWNGYLYVTIKGSSLDYWRDDHLFGGLNPQHQIVDPVSGSTMITEEPNAEPFMMNSNPNAQAIKVV